MKCPHCKGTGEAPVKLAQECIGCQRKMMVTFEAPEDLTRHDGIVYCADCKRNGFDKKGGRGGAVIQEKEAG